jgi:hypothetical protein
MRREEPSEPRTQRSGVSGLQPLTPLRCVRNSDETVAHYLAARAAEELSAWDGPRAVAMAERVAGIIVSLTE